MRNRLFAFNRIALFLKVYLWGKKNLSSNWKKGREKHFTRIPFSIIVNFHFSPSLVFNNFSFSYNTRKWTNKFKNIKKESIYLKRKREKLPFLLLVWLFVVLAWAFFSFLVYSEKEIVYMWMFKNLFYLKNKRVAMKNKNENYETFKYIKSSWNL